jgi:ATP-dependent helicase HrpB
VNAKLPIHDILPNLLEALRSASNAVLIAPPGAGKTTMVAAALLAEKWCTGQILLLSPRRLAARMAAERIAELLGERVGGIIGYATRMDSKKSAATRILVLTEGIFRSRIIADPELSGVFSSVVRRGPMSEASIVILGLRWHLRGRTHLGRICGCWQCRQHSMARDSQSSWAARQSLKVKAKAGRWICATSDGGRSSPSRMNWPMLSDIHCARSRVMCWPFFPACARLNGRSSGSALFPTTSSSTSYTDRSIRLRNVLPCVLTRRVSGRSFSQTNIAETSLTIDGVRIVIDSGLARRARFDQAAGVTRLVTERASLSAATQRAGRAARQGPGIAYRLWEEAGNGGLPPFDPPEILESDLTALLLDCALWGESDPARLRWLDAPPKAATDQARNALVLLGAVDDDGRITEHGKAIAKLPLPPNLAHMVLLAARTGQAKDAAMLAILLQERGLGGQGEDIEQRFQRFRNEKGGRVDAAMRLAGRVAEIASQAARVERSRDTSPPRTTDGPLDYDRGERLCLGQLVALAFPERIAKRRDAKGENWLTAMGRGLRLDAASPLARADWLAVADMQGAASGAHIMSAASITEAEVIGLFADGIETATQLRYDKGNDRVEARILRRLGAIVLAEGPSAAPPRELVAKALLQAVIEDGIEMLPWSEPALALRQRAVFAGELALSDEALLVTASEWLLPLLTGITRLRDVPRSGLANALDNLLGWDVKQRIDQAVPPHFTSPAGTTHAIDYAAEAGPTVELRVQALFGLDRHPAVGVERIPLVLSLTSPAGRPIQTTRNLPEFWRGSWRDVAKEMRGRYPKHNWPDAPWESVASLKTKKAQTRDLTRGA